MPRAPGAAVLVAVLLLLAACTGVGEERSARACDLSVGDVRGPRPAYVEGELTTYAADGALCRALWLPRADRWFVPQGVALDGHTAWVSGYRWRRGYGNRPCQLLRVDLRSGQRLAFLPRLEGRVGDAPEVFCRHGGGLTLDEHGLWLAETQRLWLVDPDRVGRSGAVRRVWRLERPVSGGFLVRGPRDEFGLGDFDLDRASTAHWYRFADVLRPGVTALHARAGTATAVPAHASSPAPRYAQGGAARPGERRPFLTASLSTCGVLVTPQGERLAFAPGAEGIAFDGRGSMWAVLESGSRAYQAKGRPLTPMLGRFDVGSLLAGGPETCDW